MMKARPVEDRDFPALRAIAASTGYPYPDLHSPTIEACWVVEDDGEIIAAVAAERILQLYLYPCKSLSAPLKLHAIRLLHEGMAPVVKAKGYSEVNAFVHPKIAEKFGKRLMRSFGWVANWPSFAKHL